MHTLVVRHWWNRKQGMARRTIHIREDPQTHTYQLELVQGRDEGGQRWTRVYVTYGEALEEAQKHMTDPNDEWRDITGAHQRGDDRR